MKKKLADLVAATIQQNEFNLTPEHWKVLWAVALDVLTAEFVHVPGPHSPQLRAHLGDGTNVSDLTVELLDMGFLEYRWLAPTRKVFLSKWGRDLL